MARFPGNFHPIQWAGEAGRNTSYRGKAVGYWAVKFGLLLTATVPATVALSQLINGAARVFKGHDVLPGFMAEVQDKSAPLAEGSLPAQEVSHTADSNLSAVAGANALAQYLSDGATVFSSWLPKGAEAPVDTVLDTAIHAGIATGAGATAMYTVKAGPRRPQRA